MKWTIRASRLLTHLGRHKPARLTIQDLGGLRCWVFHPAQSPAGTVLTVHGASPLGPLDPRWVQLCRGLAHAGFLALAPLYPGASRLRLSADQPAIVARTIAAAQAAPALCPGGRPPALLSVSLSGGIVLVAAHLHPDPPPAVLTIGAYGSTRRALRSLLADPGADWYAVLIAAAHVLGPPLRDALLAIAEDDFHKLPPRPGRYRRWLSPADAAIFDTLIRSPAARRALLLPRLDLPDPVLDALDPSAAVAALPSPLTLIHGTDDRVIPPSESRAIAAQRRAAGLPVRLAVTPLISHGDAEATRAQTLRHAPSLIRAMARWMAEAARRRQRA